MPERLLPIRAEGVPNGLCYESISEDLEEKIAPYLFAVFEGNEINTGGSTPAAEDRDKPWIRSNSDGTDDGSWQFSNGFWLQRHGMPVGAIMFYDGTLADLDAFDGGEAGAVTAIAGPFWTELTAMQARSPIHPGTLPSGTIINVGDNIGEEKHLMTIGELIQHNHKLLTSQDGSISGDGGRVLNAPESSLTDQGSATENTGSSPPTGFNVIGPSRGIYFIKRSARVYRRRNA